LKKAGDQFGDWGVGASSSLQVLVDCLEPMLQGIVLRMRSRPQGRSSYPSSLGGAEVYAEFADRNEFSDFVD
jgi:hypothetical protein